MTIKLLGADGNLKDVAVSDAMEKHFSVPINHANTILNQINSGMYKRWFEGRSRMVCMDFGANVGLVSLYMLQFSKELYAIEPTPSHYELLKELLLLHQPFVYAKIEMSKRALTATEGTFLFATGHSTENKITSEQGYGNQKIEVEGKPLSWFVGDKTIDFCKIDIESGEMLALTVEELKKVKGYVKTFFVEVHPGYNGGMDENRNELLRRFKEAGYNTEVIDYQTIIAYES